MWPNLEFSADLGPFLEEILKEKLHFLWGDTSSRIYHKMAVLLRFSKICQSILFGQYFPVSQISGIYFYQHEANWDNIKVCFTINGPLSFLVF